MTKAVVRGFLFSMVFLCCAGTAAVSAQMNYAGRMAETVMQRYPDSMVVKKFPQHMQQDGELKPNQSAEDARSHRPPRWSYEIGVVLMGFERLSERTGEKRYIEYVRHILDYFIDAEAGSGTS